MNAIKKVLKKEKGFTLIELLIVIAIIAVLAMLIIPRVTTSLDDANNATNKANVKLVQSAVERYYFKEKSYPTTDGSDGGTTGVSIDFTKLVNGKYIDAEPNNASSYKLVNGIVTP